MSLAITRDGLFLQNPFIVAVLRFSYVSMTSVKRAVAYKQANKFVWIFMDKYCLSCWRTRCHVYFVHPLNFKEVSKQNITDVQRGVFKVL